VGQFLTRALALRTADSMRPGARTLLGPVCCDGLAACGTAGESLERRVAAQLLVHMGTRSVLRIAQLLEMKQQPEVKGWMREADLNVFVTVRRRFRIVFPYEGERRTDVRMLIPVEERPHLMNRAVASAFLGSRAIVMTPSAISSGCKPFFWLYRVLM
jgi:hypothetical protein